MVHPGCRHNWAGNRPCPCRDRRAANWRPWQDALRYIASKPADRDPSNRSYLGRRSAERAATNPGSYEQVHRISRCRRAGDSYPSRHQRSWLIYDRGARRRNRLPDSRTGYGDVPASNRRAHREVHARQSPTWHSRDSSTSSHRQCLPG